MIVNLLMILQDNIVKIQKKTEQEELVDNEPQVYLAYQFLHNLQPFLLWNKKNENIKFSWNQSLK